MVIDAKRLSARVLVVVCLASLAGLAAWVATKGKTPIYEQTVSFVVVPQNGISQVPSTVDATIAAGIGSKVSLNTTLRQLGYSPGSMRLYTLNAFVRPGSDFIDAKLRGPNTAILAALGREYVKTSRVWAANKYAPNKKFKLYRLDFVEALPTPGKVSPHPKRTAALGFVLGGLLGLLVLYAESQVKSRRRQQQQPSSVLELSEAEPARYEDLNGEQARDDAPVRVATPSAGPPRRRRARSRSH